MGIKEGFTGAPMLMKICFIVLLVAQICNYIAFTIPQWGKRYRAPVGEIFTGYGIWRMCNNYEPVTGCSPLDGIRVDWYAAVQAFAVIGFLGINLAFLIVTIQMFTSKCKGVSDLSFWNAIQCFVTAVCYLLAVILFGAYFDNGGYHYISSGIIRAPGYGFAFGLAIIALILEVVAGVLILVSGKGGSSTGPS